MKKNIQPRLIRKILFFANFSPNLGQPGFFLYQPGFFFLYHHGLPSLYDTEELFVMYPQIKEKMKKIYEVGAVQQSTTPGCQSLIVIKG